MRELNFQGLQIRRMASHTVLEKQRNDACAKAEVTTELLTFDYDQERLILERLRAAMGRKGKGFYLEIADSFPSSFFGHCLNLNKVNDQDFLKRSQDIAHLLAEKTTRSAPKSGYLMVIDAIDTLHNNEPVYIVIKADPQEALRRNAAALEHVKDLVMSPAQKFYKVGVLYMDMKEGDNYPNNSYSGFLFDDQFNSGNSNLSAYFYKSFLGFDLINNGPLQTKNFFERTSQFIDKSIKDEDKKEELAEALRVLVKTDQAEKIYPKDFADHYLESDEEKALFNATITKDFPTAIIKDTALLDFSLKTRKVKFNDVQISAPDNSFADHVKVIKNEAEFANLDPNDKSYTIVKIMGKPSSVIKK
jgi:37-kD nucleoid-associated bacterial protein